jgi:hypothetical protein
MTQKILSIYVAWKRADLIFRYFDKSSNKLPTKKRYYLITPAGINIILGHALLFVVLEAMKQENIIPPSLVEDADCIYDDLRVFRNGVFHVQPKAFSDKLKGFMKKKEFAQKVKRVHTGLGEHLVTLLEVPESEINKIEQLF